MPNARLIPLVERVSEEEVEGAGWAVAGCAWARGNADETASGSDGGELRS